MPHPRFSFLWLLCAGMILLTPALSPGQDDVAGAETSVEHDIAERAVGETVPDSLPFVYLNEDEEINMMVREAESAAAEGRWQVAFETFQDIVDQFPKHVYPEGNGIYVRVRDYCQQQLSRLPPEAMRVYRSIYDEVAHKAYQSALVEKDVNALKEVAERWTCTSWGDDALDSLATVLMERGDYWLALRSWRRLRTMCRDTDLPEHVLRLKMLICEKELGIAGADAHARELLERFADREISLGGRTVTISRFLEDEIGKLGATEISAPSSYPMVGGSPTRMGSGPLAEGPGPLRWSSEIPETEVTDEVVAQLEAKGFALPYQMLPIVDEDRVFLQNGSGVFAFDLASGQEMWRYPRQIPRAPKQLADDLSYSPTVVGGRVFARLSDRIVAVSREDGALLWERRFDDEAGPFSDAEAVSQVVVDRGLLLVGVTRAITEAEAYLVCLDASTGKERWRTFVCSTTKPPFLGKGRAPSAPSIGNGVVYFSTNIGAMAAVEADSGSILWVSVYDSFPPELFQWSLENHNRWFESPPVVGTSMVYAAPRDCDRLIAFDLGNGQLVWEQRRGDKRFLIGSDGRRIYAAGSTVSAADVMTGKLVWETPESVDGTLGRPHLADNAIYLPTSEGVVRLAADDGQLIDRMAWQSGGEIGGNIIAVGDAVLTASLRSLHVYDGWESTRKKLEGSSGVDAQIALAKLHRLRGEENEAIALLKDVHEVSEEAKKELAFSMNSLAMKRESEEDYDEALKLYREARELAADTAMAVGCLIGQARCAERLLRWTDAIEAYQQIVGEFSFVEYSFEAGLKIRAGWFAEQRISEIIHSQGRNVYEPFEAEAQSNLTRTGEEAYRSVMEKYPNSEAAEAAAFALAELYVARGSLDAGAQLLQERSDYFSGARKQLEALRLLAEICEQQENFSAARRVFVEMDARFSKARIQVGSEKVSVREFVEKKLAEEKFASISSNVRYFGLRPPLTKLWQTGIDLTDEGLGTGWGYFQRRVLFPQGEPEGRARYLVFISTPTGVECRESSTGALVWEAHTVEGTKDGAFVGDRLLIWGDSTIACHKLGSGELVWRYRHRNEGAAKGSNRRSRKFRLRGIVSTEEQVIVRTGPESLTGLSIKDGSVVWQTDLDGDIFGSPLLLPNNDVVVLTENPATVHVLKGDSGEEDLRVAVQTEDNRLTSEPILLDDSSKLAFVTGGHRIHVFDVISASEIWTKRLDPYTIDILLDVPGDDTLLSTPRGEWTSGEVVALDTNDGSERWKRKVDTGGLRSTMADAGVVYLLEELKEEIYIAAVESLNGEMIWQALLGGGPNVFDAVLTEGHIVITSKPSAEVFVVSRKKGGSIDRIKLGKLNISSVAPMQGGICVATERGYFGFGTVNEQYLHQRALQLRHNSREYPEDISLAEELASVYFKMGRYDSAVDTLSDALLITGTGGEAEGRLAKQMEAYKEAANYNKSTVMTAPKLRERPEIDGVLKERWLEHRSALMISPRDISSIQSDQKAGLDWNGRHDLSAKLYVGWDDENFYYALDVTDDRLNPFSFNSATWRGDGLLVAIDPHGDGGYGLQAVRRDYVLTQALADPKEKRKGDDQNKPEGEFFARVKPDQSGVIYEGAIPWKYIDGWSGKEGESFGFNVYVIDDDGGGAKKGVTWTSGITLHQETNLLFRGYAPELFGKIVLEGDDSRKNNNDQENERMELDND